jgi:hypothetical protein
LKLAGFAKSPSAALRNTFVTAGTLQARFIPQVCKPCNWSFLLCRTIPERFKLALQQYVEL